MKCLFLNLASHEGSIACVSSDETVSIVSADHRLSDHDLPRVIEEALKEAGWNTKDLTHVACVTGPGGFTSLRVAAATVNALRYTLDIEACGIHLSDVLHARSTQKDVWWVHSTKKDVLFVRGFGAHASVVPDPSLFTINDNLLPFKSGDTWMGELIPTQEAFLEELGASRAVVHPLADILPALLVSRTYKKEDVMPWYGRTW